MTTRREFLSQTAAASLVAATAVQVACTAEGEGTVASTKPSKAARHSGPRIKSVIRREETVVRHGGNGDNWHMSWAADDRQYMSLCDGSGFSDSFTSSYNSRMFAIEGGPRDAKFHDLPGYPLLGSPSQKSADARYYNFGTLALDGRLYQFMSTFNRSLAATDWTNPAKITDADLLRFVGAKLIYSPDNGRTWCNQDGRTPVVWEDWNNRSRETLVFFEEDQEAFSLLTVLQMGRNYELNRDGYVYVYAPNGNTEGTMNELVMFRVPKARILDRGAYEYFAGLEASGNARWSPDLGARKPVHTFPRGWVNRLWHPYAWHPSVVYNAPLGVYMMANWGMGSGTDTDGFYGVKMDDVWFAKPSYLGFWIAPNPWGPWTQIHEETAWMPEGDAKARAYQPQIAPKWIAPDGNSFWLVWTDFQIKGDKDEFRRANEPYRTKGNDLALAERAQMDRNMRKFMPYYAFNLQRVDLVLA
jgi:Domain of unknown function (DUF4185)